MWQSFHDAWWRLATQSHPTSFRDAFACRVLQTGSAAYHAAVTLRNTAYDRHWARQVRLPCPVVSVGNLTVGGTGKTACVELITRKLTALGKRVAILSRGYGGLRGEYWLRSSGQGLEVNGRVLDSDASTRPSGSLGTPPSSLPMGLRDLADEPQMLASHLEGVPILVGARRDRSGHRAVTEFGAEALILDDGFQHRRVMRDCDIVLVHARMPLGGWALLPRGPMREPMAALRRAHVVMVTKADEAFETVGALTERLHAFNPDAALVTAMHEPVRVTDGISGQSHGPKRLEGARVGLVSSIGDPEGFEATVQRLHAGVAWHRMFPDHHRYRPEDWDDICAQVRQHAPEAIVTTEKDRVRLRPLVAGRPPEVPVWILGVAMRLVSGEEEFDARLAGLYAR